MTEELGLEPLELAVGLADFTYRAEMSDGTVEHEVCPVAVVLVDGEPSLNPDEVDAYDWLEWSELLARAADRPESLSPWAVEQIELLDESLGAPHDWFADPPYFRPDGELPARAPADPASPFGGLLEPMLERYVSDRTDELIELHPQIGELSDRISRLVAAGGKRLRPAFVHWGHRAAGGTAGESPDVARVAMAVEMLHTFALLHDDVMDRSAMRRGLPSAHVDLAAMRRAARPRDDAEWFGISAAIVAGDLAFVWADELIDQLEATRRRRPPGALDVYTLLRTEVIAGQYLDLRGCGSDDATDRAGAADRPAQVRPLHRHPPARARRRARRRRCPHGRHCWALRRRDRCRLPTARRRARRLR